VNFNKNYQQNKNN